MNRFQRLFGALVVAQMAHSAEEIAGRLYESFPPARFVSGLASADHRRGFIAINIGIAVAGVLCLLFPVRLRWASARAVALVWSLVELSNGVVHPLWSVYQRGYTPGVVTAPALFVLALLLLRELRRETPPS